MEKKIAGILILFVLYFNCFSMQLCDDTFINLYNDVSDTVVSIKTFIGDNITPSFGSGFFVSEDGYIITNNHVIADGNKFFVETKDNRKYSATLIATYQEMDLALLKIDTPRKFKPVKFGDSNKLQRGTLVFVLGSPLALNQTYTMAMVSNIHKTADILGMKIDNMIQLDGTLNPGNSGGPAFNLDGEVIGINFAIHNFGQGMGFCISSNEINKFWNVILKEIKKNETKTE
ncbi:trypsin-like peptidase domain-containing protein [Candidatus Pacearchaeota archaeon]|nr:trypsin-like peptidase domain-containing protein [bacterium]MCK9597035.1 trypsin-like peptidase domain-containing protein [Candidatus Pacearchaeota archaeon]